MVTESEYNIYEKSDNKFVGTFKTLLELKQWAYRMLCDFDEENIKRDIDMFYKLKNAKAKETQQILEDWLDWHYKKEEMCKHEEYLDEFGKIIK